MKFPLAMEPFAPFELSPSQRGDLERLADQLVDATIAEYEHFVNHQNRVVDSAKWRAVKTREDVTVFKARSAEKGSEPEWTVLRLLAYGSITGTLDDAMYGDISFDDDGILIKTSYINDEIVDGRVLCQMRSPTDEDPFRFLGIKWIVKAHSTAVNAVVKARDMVMLDALGVHTRPNGERLGYQLMHSLDLRECPELKPLGIVRGKISTCLVFKQTQRHTVEVYMKSFVNPGGSVPEALALGSAASGLIGCWKLMWCAENKKLAFLAKEAARSRARRHETRPAFTNGDGKDWCCSVCAKSLSAFRKGVACEICWQQVCTKCRTARKLTRVCPRADGDGGIVGELAEIRYTFCGPCLARSKRTNAFDIARYEHVPGALEQRRREARSGYTSGSSSTSTPDKLPSQSDDEECEVETVDDWLKGRMLMSTSSDGSDSFRGYNSSSRRR